MAHKLSEKEHANILEMLNAGLTTKKISTIAGRSPVTVQRVRRFQDYSEYEKASHLAAYKKGPDKPKQIEENPLEEEDIAECDPEALKIRVSFELGETARKAIDGLLALVGVKL